MTTNNDQPVTLGEDEILWPKQYLPMQFFVLVKGVTQRTAPVMQERYNLTIHEWRAMLIIAAYPGITANDIANHLHSDKMVISRAVNGLLQKKSLVRNTDPRDRRRNLLFLTKSGARKYRDILVLAHKFEADMRAALSDEEREILEVILEKLTRRVREMPLD